ncbi:myb-like DNA-binding domain-containing protein [Sodiomyces alkalinus F11]|uniref:Myb-like DNA-binding domain-containing protein n=1 Tax=Sodiomyces alkalinus (strain CBS 110278 / VKM F-3762 / F11) TaxID=1314773 RepID=A0A3N2Q580_SODAK|nr:myb-like DNA-binding domain-containing protein [Sodiomyces alkalinus F11]ROT41808.1 myb-like DNA-binding domain-containing protein [Sodiomyces alkalinus F11]
MPVVKGGVWTNIEDEILKASVSKYGLNQWARVSSLLARKTPKQCKARWNEWLDPSIKKIEWSKEEDEKLLHLAKLMPTQWRTIAPIVGRTANQCLERYQKLLDEAEAREASSLGLTGPEGGETQAPSADDVRRLRPGEVDPDPETKPARPDTIDLDEDEKEMLSEARARLANTQGKKAKRKARERQQEESRRLAALQKRRELKTAGINIKIVTRKKGQMDYNADIPFEKKPTLGFYDTAEEQVRNEKQREALDPRKQHLASKRKGDGDEDGDSKRRKKDKDAPSASIQAAIKAGQMQKIREAEQSSKRRPLNLPTPQVSDAELEAIVKMGMMGEKASTVARQSENDATRGLVSEYSTLHHSSAPIRTPRAPPQEDHIANEIRNIRALTNTQSSLLGGENTPLHEGAGTTGFDGIAPRRQVVATPNPMATPLRPGQEGGGIGATPGRTGQTPFRTPRDSFALNAADGAPPLASATPRDLKMRELTLRDQVKKGLGSLPKPKDTEWELELPEEQQETTNGEEVEVEDAGERDRRERELRQVQEALERRRRTQVMQKELPRPATVDVAAMLAAASQVQDEARVLIAKEAAALVANDAAKFPLPGSKLKGGVGVPPLATISDSDLDDARLQILVETKSIPKLEQIQAYFEGRGRDSLRLGLGCYGDNPRQEEATMRAAFDAVQESIIASAEEGAKLEKKLALHLGGYQKRQKMLKEKIGSAAEALEKANKALSGFKTLAISEEVAIARRLEALREEVGFVSRREREAQEMYRRTKEEHDAFRMDGVNGVH